MLETFFYFGAGFIIGFICACWIIRRALRLSGPVAPNKPTSGYGVW